MRHPEHLARERARESWWERSFPYSKKYPKPLPNQLKVFEILEEEDGNIILELPTGTGKTLIGYVFLKAAKGEGPVFFISPNKTLVQQIKALHPDVKVAYGRSEYDCLYYEPKESFKADEIPCLLLTDCPHRVDQKTGETLIGGVALCPYYEAKYEAKKGGGIVDATMSFHLFTQFFSKEFEKPVRLVIDEAHRIADVVRSSLSYEITDYHLYQAIDLFLEIGAVEQADQLNKFLKAMVRMVKRRTPRTQELLKDEEIVELIDLLSEIDQKSLKEEINKAMKAGLIDKLEKREVLNKVQTFVYDLRRYLTSLEYSRFTEDRKALNYTCAFWREERDLSDKSKVQYKLIVKAYYVAPIVKRILGEQTLAMSATIGDPDIFSFETGITGSFHSLTSDFPAKNARVFLPTDVANLSYNARSMREPNQTLRRVIRAAKLFAKKGHRSLVVVVSETERQKFLKFSEEEGLKAISYGNGVLAKEAVERFKDGEGDALVGTAVHYSEGIDLPKQIAPVIFYLRPDYPNPNDPLTQFEERRFSMSRVWGLRQWRVMKKALQVRGRNIRSKTAIGVCFFMSQQFTKFLENSLPQELRRSLVMDKKFDECVKETLQLLE